MKKIILNSLIMSVATLVLALSLTVAQPVVAFAAQDDVVSAEGAEVKNNELVADTTIVDDETPLSATKTPSDELPQPWTVVAFILAFGFAAEEFERIRRIKGEPQGPEIF